MRIRPRPTKKQSRQHVLLQIIKEQQIKTQDELRNALAKYGFHITQSSLSRDITEMGLVKQHGHYVVSQRPKQGPTPPITSIEAAGPNLIVVKTLAGMAAPVGITIDENKPQNIIGTVAGDDTVFIATSPGSSHESIIKMIRKLFKGE